MALAGMSATAQVPTVWVSGDSTANNVDHRGWGDPFAGYFDQEKAHTMNRARAGRVHRAFSADFKGGAGFNVREDDLQIPRIRFRGRKRLPGQARRPVLLAPHRRARADHGDQAIVRIGSARASGMGE